MMYDLVLQGFQLRHPTLLTYSQMDLPQLILLIAVLSISPRAAIILRLSQTLHRITAFPRLLLQQCHMIRTIRHHRLGLPLIVPSTIRLILQQQVPVPMVPYTIIPTRERKVPKPVGDQDADDR